MSRHLLSWDLAVGSPTPALRAWDWDLWPPAAWDGFWVQGRHLEGSRNSAHAGVQGGLLGAVREAGGFPFISLNLQRLPLKTKMKTREEE